MLFVVLGVPGVLAFIGGLLLVVDVLTGVPMAAGELAGLLGLAAGLIVAGGVAVLIGTGRWHEKRYLLVFVVFAATLLLSGYVFGVSGLGELIPAGAILLAALAGYLLHYWLRRRDERQ